ERLLRELRLILQEVPHDQLAVQWDTNFEFAMLEGLFPVWFEDVKGGILERLLRLSRRVPPDVELGYHLCYGDVRHRHFKEPADTRKLVDVANVLAGSLGRPLNWIHLPVPRNRVDEAYYAPLGELRLRAAPSLRVALGLRAHPGRGLDAPARRHVRASLRHGREPRLVQEPRSDGGRPGPAPDRRPAPDRLFGRHGHPARPAEAPHLRPS